MRIGRACWVIAVFAACGSNERVDISTGEDAAIAPGGDAPTGVYDFSCAANVTPPTTNKISVGGVVSFIADAGIGTGYTPAAGVSIFACDGAAANCDGPNRDGVASSGDDGAFSIPQIATAGTPMDEYLFVSKPGVRSVYAYPWPPFGAQPALPIITYDTSTSAGLLAGYYSCDESQAIAFVTLIDCNGAEITDLLNITLTVTQDGAPVVVTKSPVSQSTIAVCAIPTGATSIEATYKGTPFVTRTVKTVVATSTAVLMAPGF